MNVTEILVILFGLFVGYWIVSRLLLGNAGKPKPTEPEHEARLETSGDRDATPEEWHRILNVSPDATVDEIRRSYKTLMSQYHPDKVAELGDELKLLAERKTREINGAYQQALRQREGNT
ncbi:MAG: J domain-containing protein [Rhodocyclales bacterium]|nr:J domain-containing protein [Rhodocyclales bacterium]